MHFLRTALRGHIGLVAAAAVLLMIVGMLSVAGDTAQATNPDVSEGPGADCTDTLDNNANGWVNEGCAQVGSTSETGLQCGNVANDDTPDDTVVNDGCPARKTPNLNQSAAQSQFIIPGTPVARSTADPGVTQPPFDLMVNDTASFPTLCPPTAAPNKCQVLVSNGDWGDGDKDGAEIMTYDTKTATSFHIIERGTGKVTNPPQSKKSHPIGSKVKLATTLTADVNPGDGLQTTMLDGDTGVGGAQNITAAYGCTLNTEGDLVRLKSGDPGFAAFVPITIQLTNTTAWPVAGFVTINHQDLQTSNLLNGQSGEYFQYDTRVEGTPGTIRLIERGQQPTNRCYIHRPTGYAQPSQVATTPPTAGTPGVTKVSVHFQMNVKSNAGFFPAGNLLVCNAGNPLPLSTCELIGHNNAATKAKGGSPPAATEFHMTERCAAAANFNKVPSGCGKAAGNPTHLTGSIVTGADAFLHCRNGNASPGVDTDLSTAGTQEPATQVVGTSVGITAVCYTETQPKSGGPKVGNIADIVGQDLNVINSIAGQPFLSTGGFCHVILGAVGNGASSCPGTPPAPFDTNGVTDGVLVLGSACIPDFTPGTNLQVSVTQTVDKTLLDDDPGTIRVVLDTITGPGGGNDGNTATHDDCDDPAGTDVFASTVYDSATAETAVDVGDDTDRDGCLDERELRPVLNQGGIRDPWNPFDWYDINHDGAVSVPVDVLQVAQANGTGNPNYLARKDRGVLNYGPFGWNKSAPNGGVDVTSDVLGVAQQFSAPCVGHDPNTGTATHEQYNGGTAWPAGDGPWYVNIAGNGVANH